MDNNTKEKDKLTKEIFFHKFKIIKLISSGLNNFVFEGINIITNQKVLIKIENKIRGLDALKNESYMLFILKGYGIPELISFGHKGKYNVLVEEILGKSLQDLFELNDNEIPLKDICMIAIQLLERIEYIHSKFIIHRKINPKNFVIGEKNPSLIYAIDFSNAKKYRSSRTGNHQKYRLNRKPIGELSFASINSMKGIEQSRRDDLESLGYMLIYLLKGFLPWKEFENKKEKIQKIFELKKKISLIRLCKDLPDEIRIYMEYCRNLNFEQKPSYEYLRSLFRKILIKIEKINDNIFFWNKNKIKKIEEKNNKIDLYKRKESPLMRLYRKIHKSLDRNNKIMIYENHSQRYNLKKKQNSTKTGSNMPESDELLKNGKNINDNNKSLNTKLIKFGKNYTFTNFVYKKKNNIHSAFSKKKENIRKKCNSREENFKNNKILKIINNNSFKNHNIYRHKDYLKYKYYK